jgi:2-keto-4-pentenoate hydratase
MTDDDISRLVDQLIQAHQQVAPLPLPADMSKAEATQVKQAFLRRLSCNGKRAPVAWKVSLSMTWGALFEGDVLASGATLERAAFFDPLIETELVFRPRTAIDARMDLAEVVARCDVAAGIEIADCRWQGWHPGDKARFTRPSAEGLEADNAFAARLVVDDNWVDAASLDLPATRVDARRDGRLIAGGTLDHVMGHPAQAVRWLAQQLAENGQQLPPGALIATGNPYRELVTLACGEQASFESVVAGVGTAHVRFL